MTLMATACSSDSTSSGSGTTSGSAETELTVFAASSLTGAFTQIGTGFEAANPGVQVTFNFGSSTDLAAQIASEGTADVFASASGTAMDAVALDPGVMDQTDFATNQLVIITPTDNPANIGSVNDLANDGVQVVARAPRACRSVTTRGRCSTMPASPRMFSRTWSPTSRTMQRSWRRYRRGRPTPGSSTHQMSRAQTWDPSRCPTTSTSWRPTRSRSSPARRSPISRTSFVSYVTGEQGQATLASFGFGPPPG